MNRDFRDLLSEFNVAGAEYLVIGAHALAASGAPLHDLTSGDLSRPGTVFQIGVAPVRIDVTTGIDGVEFDTAWAERLETQFAGLRAWVISRRLLIAKKKAAGRLQDLADVEQLEKLGSSDDET